MPYNDTMFITINRTITTSKQSPCICTYICLLKIQQQWLHNKLHEKLESDWRLVSPAVAAALAAVVALGLTDVANMAPATHRSWTYVPTAGLLLVSPTSLCNAAAAATAPTCTVISVQQSHIRNFGKLGEGF